MKKIAAPLSMTTMALSILVAQMAGAQDMAVTETSTENSFDAASEAAGEVPSLFAGETAAEVTADVDVVMLSVDPAEGLSDKIDPLVRDEIVGLRTMGIVKLQSEISNDLITIDRLQSRAKALEDLMGTLGVEGLKQFDPQIYEAMKDSPLVLAQKIEELKLRKELEEIMNPVVETPPPAPASQADPMVSTADSFDNSPFGSQQFATSSLTEETISPVMPVMPFMPFDEVMTLPTEQADMTAGMGVVDGVGLSAGPISMPEPAIQAISLREIYGAGQTLNAVISFGDDVFQVEVGDMLPNDTEILSISDDRIKVRRADEVMEFFLKG